MVEGTEQILWLADVLCTGTVCHSKRIYVCMWEFYAERCWRIEAIELFVSLILDLCFISNLSLSHH